MASKPWGTYKDHKCTDVISCLRIEPLSLPSVLQVTQDIVPAELSLLGFLLKSNAPLAPVPLFFVFLSYHLFFSFSSSLYTSLLPTTAKSEFLVVAGSVQ